MPAFSSVRRGTWSALARTLRTRSCGGKRDNHVNFGESTADSMWTEGEQPQVVHTVTSGDRRPNQTAAVTSTGMPLRTEVPESGSIALSSDSTLEFTPACSAATRIRVPGAL